MNDPAKPEELWWCWECRAWLPAYHDSRPTVRIVVGRFLAVPFHSLGRIMYRIANTISTGSDRPSHPPIGYVANGQGSICAYRVDILHALYREQDAEDLWKKGVAP